jgi:hypothetical protein
VRVTDGSIQALTFGDDGLIILHTTPFQRLPQPTGVFIRYLAALHGLDPPENLPYGLDVWRGGKKLNIEWSDAGQVVVRSYKSRRLGARPREPLISVRIMAHCAFDSRATAWTVS